MSPTVHMPALMSGVTVAIKITGRRRTAWRCWLGVLVLRLAELIIGCVLVVDFTDEAAPAPITVDENGFPSALSMTPGERGYRADATSIGSSIRIFLDGVEQQHATAYDIDIGTVTRAIRDGDRLVVRRDGVCWETVRGVVTVEPRQGRGEGEVETSQAAEAGTEHRPSCAPRPISE